MGVRWRTTADNCVPEAVECAEVGHPHQDAGGLTQYDNTHFDTEAEAWAYGRSNVMAGLSLATRALGNLELRVAEAKDFVVVAAKLVSEFEAASQEMEP